MKDFFMRRMLKSRMKDVPEQDQRKMLEIIEKNPGLFQQIGHEIQEQMKSGRNQQDVMMDVLRKYENELRKLV
jgi:hypothetical protein